MGARGGAARRRDRPARTTARTGVHAPHAPVARHLVRAVDGALFRHALQRYKRALKRLRHASPLTGERLPWGSSGKAGAGPRRATAREQTRQPAGPAARRKLRRKGARDGERGGSCRNQKRSTFLFKTELSFNSGPVCVASAASAAAWRPASHAPSRWPRAAAHRARRGQPRRRRRRCRVAGAAARAR